MTTGISFPLAQRTPFTDYKPFGLLLVNVNRIIFPILVGGEISIRYEKPRQIFTACSFQQNEFYDIYMHTKD
jgi:hypothetical protein